MASSKVVVEVARMKKLRQEEDSPFPPSASVEVSVVGTLNLDDESADPEPVSPEVALRVRSTRVIKETSDPFFNESLEFDVTSFVFPETQPATAARMGSKLGVRMEFRAMDNYFDPPHVIGSTMLNFPISENKKGEHTATICATSETVGADPGTECGTLIVRFVTKVTKPTAPVEDVNADVVLSAKPELTGNKNLIPQERLYLWWHLMHDPDFCSKLGAALAKTFVPEKAQGGRRGAGSRSASASRPAKEVQEEETYSPTSITGVIVARWKCKRIHQVFTKLRLSAERFAQMGAANIAFSPEDEMAWKYTYKEWQSIRDSSIAAGPAPAASIHPSVRAEMDKKAAAEREKAAEQPPVQHPPNSIAAQTALCAAVDDPGSVVNHGAVKAEMHKLFLLFATDEDVDDMLGSGMGSGGVPNWTPTFEQSSALSFFQVGRAEYECLLACMLERIVPTLDQRIAEQIAKEQVDNDTVVINALRVPADPNAPESPAPAEGKKAPPIRFQNCKGENAFLLFCRALRTIVSFWCETITESEYCLVLRSFSPAIRLAKQRAEARLSFNQVGGGTTSPKKKAKKGKKTKK